MLRLPHQELAGHAHRLRSRLGSEPNALVAAFPGHAEAVTALAVREHRGLVEWRTWHAYPVSRELVVTTTRLRAR